MLEFAVATARRAGHLLLERSGAQRTLTYKGAIDLTTDADRASEALIVAALRARFPEHAIIAEEGSDHLADSAFTWVIDPIDGTTNYAHGFPYFSVSIGLLRDGQPLLGVVYDPNRDELFAGERGQGVTLNGQVVRVSAAEAVLQSVCATGFPYDRATAADNNLAEFGRVLLRAQEVRRVGSAALELAYVAAGRLDAQWEKRLKPWDTAAGALLVLEAGGTVTTLDGGPWSPFGPDIVASNGVIHAELLDILRG